MQLSWNVDENYRTATLGFMNVNLQQVKKLGGPSLELLCNIELRIDHKLQTGNVCVIAAACVIKEKRVGF